MRHLPLKLGTFVYNRANTRNHFNRNHRIDTQQKGCFTTGGTQKTKKEIKASFHEQSDVECLA